MLSIVLMLLSTPAHAKYLVFLKCPQGTRIESTRTESGTEVYCEKSDGQKEGPYARFDARGKRTHDGIYKDNVPVIRAFSSYDQQGHLVKRQMIKGDGETKELQTVMLYWDR